MYYVIELHMNQEMAQSRQKVLFLITKATWGGAQRYVYDLARSLPAQYEPMVAYGVRGRLADELEKAGIATMRIESLDRNVAVISDIACFFEIRRAIRTIKPAVLHVNSSKAAGLGALAGRLAGIRRIVFTAHGWPHKEPRGALSRAAILTLSWITSALSHTTIVVSKDDEAIGRRMPLVGKRISYIPIGRSLPTLFTREVAWLFFRGLAPKLRANKQAPRIVTIAELTRNKGIRYAVDAIATLKSRGIACTYTVIGDGEEYEALVRYAQERDVLERIAFVGFVPDAAQYLRAFDYFLLPSLKEGMPYVLLEAGDADLPIIATTAANPAIADTYQRVSVVEPGDPDAIADAAEAAFKTPAPPQGLREESRYPLREMVERTTALY